MKIHQKLPFAPAGKEKVRKRAKTKEPSSQPKDDDEEEDISVTGSSLVVGIKNVQDLIKAMASGTEEFQDLMTYECSLIYECSICRNLFRSAANFISHKRKYCRQRCRFINNGPFSDQSGSKSAVQPSVVEVTTLPDSNAEAAKINGTLSVIDPLHMVSRSPMKILNRLFNATFPTQLQDLRDTDVTKKMPFRSNSAKEPIIKGTKGMKDTIIADRIFLKEMSALNEADVNGHPINCRLEKIPQSKIAVYQAPAENGTLALPLEERPKDPQSEPGPPDGKQNENGVPPPTETENNLVCPQCSASYPSQRDLERHISVYHQPRLCYPCPICKFYFSSPFSVYRHLNKNHHKTEEQIRRLRMQVITKASKRELYQEMKNMPDTVISESKVDAREEQKWIAQFEGELHCSTCGKSFTRRAALTVHSAKCKSPGRPVKESEPVSLNCQKCGRLFSRRAVLVVHEQGCEGPGKSSPVFPCGFCGRSFLRRRALDLHMPRCPHGTKPHPLPLLGTPQKMALPQCSSPSSIQVRQDYCKTPRCTCPLPCALHPLGTLVGKLGAVVRRLHDRPSIERQLIEPLRRSTEQIPLQGIASMIIDSSHRNSTDARSEISKGTQTNQESATDSLVLKPSVPIIIVDLLSDTSNSGSEKDEIITETANKSLDNRPAEQIISSPEKTLSQCDDTICTPTLGEPPIHDSYVIDSVCEQPQTPLSSLSSLTPTFSGNEADCEQLSLSTPTTDDAFHSRSNSPPDHAMIEPDFEPYPDDNAVPETLDDVDLRTKVMLIAETDSDLISVTSRSFATLGGGDSCPYTTPPVACSSADVRITSERTSDESDSGVSEDETLMAWETEPFFGFESSLDLDEKSAYETMKLLVGHLQEDLSTLVPQEIDELN